MRITLLLLALALPATALGQSTITPPVPQKHIPTSVLAELRAVEDQFDMALSHDCAPEKCVSKGCIYVDHVVVDSPNTSSLPGLPANQGPGSVPAQEYLTAAHCEFATEKAVSAKDVQILIKRLEDRLSRGWLRVTVSNRVLDPIPASLAESPLPKEQVQPPPPQPKPEPPPAPPPPPKWEASVALRELWLALLPHFFWMIGVFLGTLAVLALIWGARRMGRESLEERALRSQLENGANQKEQEPTKQEEKPAAEEGEKDGDKGALSDDERFVAEQRLAWSSRIAQADLTHGESTVADLLRQWLKDGDFDLLAKAIFVFGDRLSEALPSDGELAVRKVEFAHHLRGIDEKKLPGDVDFFRKLNLHALSSSLLAQSDAAIYQSLLDEFGSVGVAHLIESLPGRFKALLFAFVSSDCQREVVRLLTAEQRKTVARELLRSNRIAREEQAYLFEAVSAARSGKALPGAPQSQNNVVEDRGREFDAAGALSVLLPHVDGQDRQALFAQVLERSGGTLPQWFEDILYPDMLFKVPNELRNDLLLDVDMRALAGWSSLQEPAWQEQLLVRLPASLQTAVRAQMSFESRADQLAQARRGRNELVSGVKKLLARGKLSLPEIVA
jgi:hypothetical protein